MPFRLGPWEIGLIVLIFLIVFGAGRLPQVGSALGKSINAFRKGKNSEDDGAAPRRKTIGRSQELKVTKRTSKV
jgi:sec-independent protein translocase protein TatA